MLDDVIDLQDGITVVGVADGFRIPASRVLTAPFGPSQHSLAYKGIADSMKAGAFGTPLIEPRTLPLLSLCHPLHVQLGIAQDAEPARLERQRYQLGRHWLRSHWLRIRRRLH
ncbi:hypothetical protein [Streptomyces sp. SS162]|uniref:hypothetical protein n=1 Tax=Streptomyces sp. SS162 TaxID=3108484 RepID=UPI002F42B52A